MAERLTDEELGEVDVLFKDEDDLVFRPTMNHKLDRFFTLFVKLLTEVRERREQDATHLKHAEAAVQLHARCELLEACLRECVDLDHGLLRLGGDIEKSSGEGVDWDHVAIGAADGILTRAHAALAKGGA